MPVYEFKCANGHSFTRFLKIADYDLPQTCKRCGGVAERQISAPRVMGDLKPYTCPITNKLIEGRKAHEENLKVHGCRVLEPGEREDFDKRKKQQDIELEKSINASVERFVEAAPAEKLERLANEISSGVSAEYYRGEV